LPNLLLLLLQSTTRPQKVFRGISRNFSKPHFKLAEIVAASSASPSTFETCPRPQGKTNDDLVGIPVEAVNKADDDKNSKWTTPNWLVLLRPDVIEFYAVANCY
jgi:hypothetical protein